MAHVSPIVDEASAKVLQSYVARVTLAKEGRNDSFVRKFYASFQWLTSKCWEDYADRFLKAVTLPEALIHSEIHQPSALAMDLAIDAVGRCHVCVAIAIFLRKNDRVFGNCFEKLSKAHAKSVLKLRSGVLKRVRFHLMMTHPELDFIALAQPPAPKNSRDQQQDPELDFVALAQPPAPRNGRGQQQESVIEGFGAARFGLVAYSHLARELLLFILLDTLLMESGNVTVKPEALGSVMDCRKPNLPNDVPLDIFDSVILPFYADIGQWTKRLAGATDGSLEFEDGFDPGNDAGALPHAALGPEKTRLRALVKKLNAQFEMASAEGEEKAKLLVTLAKTRDQLAVVEHQILAEMKSQSLLSGDPELYRQLDLLLTFVKEVETRGTEVWGPNDSRALFRDVFRLRFALGLMSFMGRTKLLASDHVATLARMFDLHRDPITGNALAFLKENPSTEPWGEKRSDGRHFYGVLKALADTLSPTRNAVPAPDRSEDVQSLLAQIAPLLPQKLHAIPRPEIGPVGWETELYGWAFGVQEALQSESRRRVDVCSSLAALSSVLIEMLLPSPESALNLCVDLVNQALPKGEPQLHVPASTLADRREFSRHVQNIQHSPDDLVTKGALTLLDDLMAALLRKDAQKALDELDSERRNAIKAMLKRSDSVPDQPDERFLYDFFTQKWADTQPLGDKERWQYLAYRLSHDLEISAYAEIYAVVSRHIASSLASPLRDLRQFYASIQSRPDFESALGDFRHSLGLLRAPRAPRSAS